MVQQLKRLVRQHRWRLLFVITFLSCLWLSQVSPHLRFDSLFSTAPVQAYEATSIPFSQATPSDLNPDRLVQQGVDEYAAGEVQRAIELWQTALLQYQDTNEREKAAIVLENLARAYQRLGDTEPEIEYWQQAEALYRQLENRQQMGRMLTEQAQAYNRLGQSRQAIDLLCGAANPENCDPISAIGLAQTTNDQLGTAAALGVLGESYRAKGDYQQAIQVLLQAEEITQKFEPTNNLTATYRTAMLNSLGNVYGRMAQVDYRRSIAATQAGDIAEADRLRQLGLELDKTALIYFQQSQAMAQQQGNDLNQLRSILNSIAVYQRIGDSLTATPLQQQALQLLDSLADSQDKVYAAIQLTSLLQPVTLEQAIGAAQSPRCLGTAEAQSQAFLLLQQAVDVSKRLNNTRASSFAFGEMGHWYECQQQYEQALTWTQQARWAAEQDLRAKDSLYLWEWQTGRIFQAQQQLESALHAYEKAVATLETIRGDLLIANRDLQFDFRDTIDPVYRELVKLRLELLPVAEQNQVINSPAPEQKQNQSLGSALKTLDSLRLAELQNYFGDDCVILAAAPEQNQVQISVGTAVFNSVILDDRTAIILSLPNGTQQISWIDVDRNTIREEVNQYRIGLESFFETFNPQQAEKLYTWIVKPFEATLQQYEIKTLVFVQDGILRSVPMSALYDGQRFLIQSYAIATTPSLALTDTQPFDRHHLRALALGLTEPAQIDNQRFPALSNVSREVEAIEAELPGSKLLLNQDFTRDRMRQELIDTPYAILHMATHGQFGTDPDNTFLVTGDRKKLSLPELDAILRQTTAANPIELLSLTACQTATGDDRAALGLAGVAIQAGVKSALASLWFVDDAATAQLATQFYANLQNSNLSKAAALQAAQTTMIEAGGNTAHPAFWAPFILIGNWL